MASLLRVRAAVALSATLAACSAGTDDAPAGDARPRADVRPSNDLGATDATTDAPDGAPTDVGVAPPDAGPDARADASADAGPRVCSVAPSPEPFRNPALRLHWRAGAGTPFAGADQVCSTPVVADIVPRAPDEDAIPEVAFMTFACDAGYRRAVLRVVSGRAPHRLLWSQNGAGMPNDERSPNLLRWDGHPAVGDLDGAPGNGLEVVVVSAAGGLFAYRASGALYWRSMDGLAGMNGPNPAINIADLDGDGRAEVIAGATVVDGRSGAVRWQGTNARGMNAQGPLSVVADLDGDGALEVIAGRTVYDAAGRVRFGMPMAEGFPAVADVLDARGMAGADGVPEVVVVASGSLHVLDGRTGAVRSTTALQGAMGAGGAPTVADFDGDGQAEVGVAGADRYTLFDPGCRAAGGGCLAPGVRWATVIEDTSSAVTSSTVFDFNGDGASEVVYNDEERFMVLDGRTGRVVFSDWNPSQTRTEQAIVADADGDGHADIVFGANTCAAFAGNTIPAAMAATQRVPGLEIWSSGDGSWVGSRSIWNEHGYHIDNVNDDGTIPRRETPSWRGHNTFRLNRARDRVLLAPDLASTPEAATCSGMTAQVCVTVRNAGDARVGTVTVAVYDRMPAAGVRPVATRPTTRALDPRGTERVCVPVPAPPREARFYVRVDDEGAARECDEANNVATVTVNCGPG